MVESRGQATSTSNAAGRKGLDKRDHVPSDPAVDRLRGEQEPARLGHSHEGYCSDPPNNQPDRNPRAGGKG